MKKLIGVIFALAMPFAAQAQSVGDVFGVSLDGHTDGNPGPSLLYTIDPVTGAGTLVGNMGYAVNSIAVDPTTGMMYATTTTWSGSFNGLLSVDPTTGVATEIGPFGDHFWAILALTFDSNGQLWGWHDPNQDDPVLIDKATGAAVRIGESGVSTARHVLAFDSANVLHMIDSSSHYIMDQVTGDAVYQSNLSFDPGAGGAAFDPATGLLWAPGTQGRTQDSQIRITDVAGNSYTDLDTDVEFLNAVTIVSETAPVVAETATFSVTKIFPDRADLEVEITLTCNGGLPLEQSIGISDGETVTFTVTNVPASGIDCSVAETGAAADYEAMLFSCEWTGVTGGMHGCNIVNQASPADFSVSVDWMISEDADPGVAEGAYVMIGCYGDSFSTSTSYDAEPDDEGPFVLAGVIPPATCFADMSAGSVVEIDAEDCDDVDVEVGDSEVSCTITATAFFEGIPTLSQWGMALMALLMLGVGFIGMRRIV